MMEPWLPPMDRSLGPASRAGTCVKALLLLLGVLLVACRAQAAECPRVVFSANPDYPPFHWVEDGKLVGASIELTERIFGELGLAAEARYLGPWKRVLRAAEQGQIDMIAALKVTPERETFLQFTTARFSANPMAVFVRTDHRIAYAGWPDLVGHVGLVARGDRFGEGFDEYLQEKLQVRVSNDMQDGFTNLLRGRGDYLVTSFFAGNAYIAANGLDAAVIALTPMVNHGAVHHGFARRSPCAKYAEAVASKLRAYESDGTTGRLIAKYTDLWQHRQAKRSE